jgi:hypothetical protein
VSTYLSTGVLEQLDQAQEELERHLVSTPGGHCRTCGEKEPCRGRVTASQTFAGSAGSPGVRQAKPAG